MRKYKISIAIMFEDIYATKDFHLTLSWGKKRFLRDLMLLAFMILMELIGCA